MNYLVENFTWEAFGLQKNPYDTTPLVEGSLLPIGKAFVGREQERKLMDKLLATEDHFAFCVAGDVGVGKTTLVNFHKYIWKYTKRNKPLFSFRREIEVIPSTLNKKTFILEILGSVLREIQLIDKELIEKHDILRRIQRIVNVSEALSISGGISIAGFGGNIGKEKSHELLLNITYTQLEQYLNDLVEFIRTTSIAGKQFQGLIVHVNNLDVSMVRDEEKVKDFFGEIRDLLQLSHIYFIFVGPQDFFKKVIGIQQRVKSIFQPSPIILGPLSKTEIIEALDERLRLLSSPKTQYIQPVENEVVYELYDLCQGDIRSIMKSLKEIVYQNVGRLPRTLKKNEALSLLAKATWDKLEQTNLTPDQLYVLKFIIKNKKEVTLKEIVRSLKKAPPNVSGYYFKSLSEANVIEVKRIDEKRRKYWYLTDAFKPLHYLNQATEELKREVSKQLKLV